MSSSAAIVSLHWKQVENKLPFTGRQLTQVNKLALAGNDVSHQDEKFLVRTRKFEKDYIWVQSEQSKNKEKTFRVNLT